ncbi:hypothetical protein [Pontibacter burrus]|nr:hypothetical protein [Pontibacter burrus]
MAKCYVIDGLNYKPSSFEESGTFMEARVFIPITGADLGTIA